MKCLEELVQSENEELSELVQCERFEPIPKRNYTNFNELLTKLALAEETYKKAKIDYNTAKNNMLLDTNWDSLNEERKEQDLPKLGSQDMKNAYVERKCAELNRFLLDAELDYNRIRRDYEVALKYTLEMLK